MISEVAAMHLSNSQAVMHIFENPVYLLYSQCVIRPVGVVTSSADSGGCC